MQVVPINYLAVVVAAVAGFGVGWVWYAVFGKAWQEGLGGKRDDMKPTPMPFIISGVSCLLMAWMLAGLISHLNQVSVQGGVISAFFVWVGFVLTTVGVNQVFQGVRPVVTAIDVGHWFAVLLLMGALIGAFGS
ncbi:MAG: DUF1761 domain-containing protein [Methyloceanibacter sp.]|uniref:DUF1761 domain-containing protein n=1 Tax=Methyloceanibacter sp. TaxID=1965321 RepID=UPI003D9B20DE